MLNVVDPIAVVERHHPYLDVRPGRVAHNPRQPTALSKALGKDDLNISSEVLADREAGAGIGLGRDEAGVEPQFVLAALHADRVQAQGAAGGTDQLAR